MNKITIYSWDKIIWDGKKLIQIVISHPIIFSNKQSPWVKRMPFWDQTCGNSILINIINISWLFSYFSPYFMYRGCLYIQFL